MVGQHRPLGSQEESLSDLCCFSACNSRAPGSFYKDDRHHLCNDLKLTAIKARKEVPPRSQDATAEAGLL